MTASLTYVLGSSNSIVWSWFFWVYVHPVASIVWFVFCFLTLLISIEVHQEKSMTSQTRNVKYDSISKPISYARNSAGISVTEVIDVVIIPPLQLPSSRVVSLKKRQPQDGSGLKDRLNIASRVKRGIG